MDLKPLILLFIICVAGSVVVLVNSRKNVKKLVVKVRKATTDLLPILSYDQQQQCYLLKNEKYMNILQIEPKDLYNTAEQDIMMDNLLLTKFFRIYEDDVKIITLNFPCDTTKQQAYFRRKIEKTNNMQYKYWLEQSLNELVYLQQHDTSREYYLMYFADNLNNLVKNTKKIKTILGMAPRGFLSELTEEKKNLILYKLNNKSSMIF